MINLSKDNFINSDGDVQRVCHKNLDNAPRKEKHARGIKMPFFIKEISKPIMTRTKLRNIFLQNWSEESSKDCTKEMSLFYVSLLRKTKKDIMKI